MVTLLPFFTLNILVSGIYYFFIHKRNNGRLPPGPPGWPIIGNLLDFLRPGVPEYRHWLEHKDKYGPISSVNVMGQTMVILHDQNAAKDLLEKSSKKTSGRPHMEFAHNLAGYGRYATNQGYNDNFRAQRKLMHQQLGTKKLVDQYASVQQAEVAHMLGRVLHDPQNLVSIPFIQLA
jgi:hypothetical protein